MTTSEPSRLDRIERILKNVAEQQQLFQSQIGQTRQIADSNDRAIAAHREEWQTSLAAHREELRNKIADTVKTIRETTATSAKNNAQLEALVEESRENIKQHEAFREEGLRFWSRRDQD